MYMQSNQPYNKVENDSVWSGALIGGAMGGAAAGGTQYGLNKYRGRLKDNKENLKSDFKNAIHESDFKAQGSLDKDLKKTADKLQGVKKIQRDRFGGGKQKAITYGASVLAGGLTGGIMDSMNN